MSCVLLSVATKHIWQLFFIPCEPVSLAHRPWHTQAQANTHTHTAPGVTQTWHLEGDALGWAWFQPDYRLRHVRETNACVRLYFPKDNIFQRKTTNVHLKAKEICFSKVFSRMCVCVFVYCVASSLVLQARNSYTVCVTASMRVHVIHYYHTLLSHFNLMSRLL